MSQFRRIMATAVLLVPILVTDARGQRLLEIDGIELYGEVQLVQAGGGTCNVLESDTGYDRRKQNDGAPMDIWRIDFTVRNRSGRWLDHLIANFEVESEWPECTNWDIPDSATLTSHFSTLVEWAGTSGFIQETGFNVVAPHESLIETRLLVVLRGDPDPWFSRSSVVDYRYAANPPRMTVTPPPGDMEVANRPPWEGPNAAALPIPRNVEAPKPDPPPDEPSVTDIYLQADAACVQGRYELAHAGFERVVELGGELADNARYRMGECHLAEDRLDEALEQFEALIRDFPESGRMHDAWYQKGLILGRMGHQSDAREIFEDILVVFPGTSTARLAKGELDAIPASDSVEAIKPDVGIGDPHVGPDNADADGCFRVPEADCLAERTEWIDIHGLRVLQTRLRNNCSFRVDVIGSLEADVPISVVRQILGPGEETWVSDSRVTGNRSVWFVVGTHGTATVDLRCFDNLLGRATWPDDFLPPDSWGRIVVSP